jgi:hypothetical protein
MFPLIGALIGSASGAAKRSADVDTQRRTGSAAADAQAVSWAKRGQQFIPEVKYAQGSMLGNVLGGALGGVLQGSNIGSAMGGGATGGFDWLKNAADPYSKATSGGMLGSDWLGDYQYDENKAKGYLGGKGPF